MIKKPSKYKRSDIGLSNNSALSDAEHQILLEMNKQNKTAK